ncbi:C-C motif chemokine 19-like isoform X1 [Hyperolius riggenbachi]|uniref:C-C motif chemokine 19-like isoform X1 n=1 Tax=Hyperolius riggenbachi TaxID=752182 RepID=UPI0035A28783
MCGAATCYLSPLCLLLTMCWLLIPMDYSRLPARAQELPNNTVQMMSHAAAQERDHPASSSRNPSDCCLKTPKAEIPSRAVKCYRRQDLSNCNFPAVVFTTVRGKHLCAPPNEPWVKQLLKLKKKC